MQVFVCTVCTFRIPSRTFLTLPIIFFLFQSVLFFIGPPSYRLFYDPNILEFMCKGISFHSFLNASLGSCLFWEQIYVLYRSLENG